MNRDEIIRMIERLPAGAIEMDVLEALYFRVQVETGVKDAAEGRVLSHAELKHRMALWRRSEGR